MKLELSKPEPLGTELLVVFLDNLKNLLQKDVSDEQKANIIKYIDGMLMNTTVKGNAEVQRAFNDFKVLINEGDWAAVKARLEGFQEFNDKLTESV